MRGYSGNVTAGVKLIVIAWREVGQHDPPDMRCGREPAHLIGREMVLDHVPKHWAKGGGGQIGRAAQHAFHARMSITSLTSKSAPCARRTTFSDQPVSPVKTIERLPASIR